MLKIFNSSEKYFQKCLDFGVECVCGGVRGRKRTWNWWEPFGKAEHSSPSPLKSNFQLKDSEMKILMLPTSSSEENMISVVLE